MVDSVKNVFSGRHVEPEIKYFRTKKAFRVFLLFVLGPIRCLPLEVLQFLVFFDQWHPRHDISKKFQIVCSMGSILSELYLDALVRKGLRFYTW